MRWSLRVAWILLGVLACRHPSSVQAPAPLTPVEAESLAVRVLKDLSSILDLTPYGTGRMQAWFPNSCGQGFVGNLEDQDGDSVFVSATLSLDCTLQNPQGTSTARGVISLTDTADLDPWVGHVRFSGLPGNPGYQESLRLTDPSGARLEYRLVLHGEVDARRIALQYRHDMNFSLDFFFLILDSSRTDSFFLRSQYRVQGIYVFAPGDPFWLPDDGLDWASGVLTLDAQYAPVGLRQVHLRTMDSLSLEDTCGFPLPIASGVLGLIAGNDTVRLDWQSCSRVAVFLQDSLVTTLSYPVIPKQGFLEISGIPEQRLRLPVGSALRGRTR